MRVPHGAVVGHVESWSDEDGWGVLRTPSGLSVFCHAAHLDVATHPSLTPGLAVYFDFETPGQDGCDARVRTAARLALPSGTEPPLHAAAITPLRDATAYVSNLIIEFDDVQP